MATPNIENLLRIVQEMQQGLNPVTDVASQINAPTEAELIQEKISELTRQEDVEAEPLTRVQQLLQGLASAGSVYASGLNRNIQPQDFGQNLLDLRQQQADRENIDADQRFGDERSSLMLELQQAIRGEDINLRVTERDEDREFTIERDKAAALLTKQDQDFRSAEALKVREARKEAATQEEAFQLKLAGLRNNVGKRAAEEASRQSVNLAQDMLMGNPSTGQKSLADQMREADQEQRQDIARRAIENVDVLMLDEDLTPNALKTLSSIRSRMIDLATSTPETLGAENVGGGPPGTGIIGALTKGSVGGNILNFSPEQFVARTIFGGKKKSK